MGGGQIMEISVNRCNRNWRDGEGVKDGGRVNKTDSESESSRWLNSGCEQQPLLFLIFLLPSAFQPPIPASSSPCRRRSPRGCHGEDPGVVRILRGWGQEHPAGFVPDRLRDPQPLHPGLLLAQSDAAEPAEQAGQLHGEPGGELRCAPVGSEPRTEPAPSWNYTG